MSKKKSLIYVYPSKSTFILRDVAFLKEDFEVVESFFDLKDKKNVPIQFIKQFFLLFRHIFSAQAVVCHFAGYSSFLPVIFCKILRKKCFVIVAGNDGSRFPDFNYGNYTKKVFGFVTGFSIQHATRVLPVHESLYFQDYTYYPGGMPAQGYAYFYPNAKSTPYSPLYYGYDAAVFTILPNATRKKNSFISIGNMADKYCFVRKGYDLILELAKLRPEMHFTLVGWDGKLEIEELPNVEILSFKTQAEVIQLFNEHQYYFQLSIMEGFPNALAEAMLCGCIPIGSNVSGIPFIIGDEKAILHQKDVQKLNEIVNLFTEKSDEELTLKSNQARTRIVENFPVERRKKELIRYILG